MDVKLIYLYMLVKWKYSRWFCSCGLANCSRSHFQMMNRYRLLIKSGWPFSGIGWSISDLGWSFSVSTRPKKYKHVDQLLVVRATLRIRFGSVYEATTFPRRLTVRSHAVDGVRTKGGLRCKRNRMEIQGSRWRERK